MMVKSFNWNGESVTVDFSKIADNGSGVLVSAAGASVFCCLDIGAESTSNFKDLSVNVVERYGIIDKIPNNYKKKDLGSEAAILISKTIDRVVRPMIRDDLSNSVKLTFYVLSCDAYSIEVLSILGASLLLNIAKIANEYFALIKITNNGINVKDALFDMFRLYHGIANNSTITYDFENLNEDVDVESIVDSYRMSLSLAKDCIEMQKSIVQSLNFKLNYFYIYKNHENTNKSEAADFASKMFEAIIDLDNKNINKFEQLLAGKNYYFNYLVNQGMKAFFSRSLNNNVYEMNDVIHEFVSDNSLLTTFLESKIFTTFVKGESGNIQYIDSAFGNIKNTFLVQFHEGSHMHEMNGSSRHELNLSNFIRRSFSLFIDKRDVIRVSCDVLVDKGSAVPCAVQSIAELLNLDVKSFAIGLNSDKKEKFFMIQDKYERKIFSDMSAIISGNKDLISAIQIDCSKVFFNVESFIKLLNFYFVHTLTRERIKNKESNFKIEVNKKPKIQKKGFSGDDYLSAFDMDDEEKKVSFGENIVQFILNESDDINEVKNNSFKEINDTESNEEDVEELKNNLNQQFKKKDEFDNRKNSNDNFVKEKKNYKNSSNENFEKEKIIQNESILESDSKKLSNENDIKKSSEEISYTSFNVPNDKVGMIIGKQGSMIKKIRNTFNVKIDIENSGKISIQSNDIQNNFNAMQYIVELLNNKK